MALPRPSKPTHRPRRSRHPRDSSSRIELTTLEPLHPVHYIILDHLFHLAPATYLRLSKGLHDYGTARLSAPVDFDEQLVSRFHESVKKQQDIRWLFPITQSRTIRFPSYRLFAMMVCFLSQVERQKRRKRKAGASYLLKLSISDSRFPEPSTLSASLTSLLRSLTSKKPSKIIIDISGPTHISLRQAVVEAIAEYISMMADCGFLSQAKMMRFEMTGRYELYGRVWRKVEERRYGKDLMRVLRSIYKFY
ncbi:hypothetical protein L202_04615 [Cryptococcus amylolentus CBS 6039]|uniref:Uncharacterized protein n=1 Tax=Cryptococcus amylolentus CBS 6039 TaxID=1295533 RepID=A0A1E3HM62_9TREE|nr:hypothetical protein L202_04615 [Cryptococcus amylolentus CBS 6039]ODN77437.1 hypothetical protein L202_04615 [Cryptococcus amylolentus CBS 6039]